jgi:hypothetical protein
VLHFQELADGGGKETYLGDSRNGMFSGNDMMIPDMIGIDDNWGVEYRAKNRRKETDCQ